MSAGTGALPTGDVPAQNSVEHHGPIPAPNICCARRNDTQSASMRRALARCATDVPPRNSMPRAAASSLRLASAECPAGRHPAPSGPPSSSQRPSFHGQKGSATSRIREPSAA